MAILIGSQAIRTLILRKEFDNYVRITDAKIHLLREVIEKLKRGEDVDVRGMLGTGDPKAEAEWNEGETSLVQYILTIIISDRIDSDKTNCRGRYSAEAERAKAAGPKANSDRNQA